MTPPDDVSTVDARSSVGRSQYDGGAAGTEALVAEAIEVIASARPMPLSASVMVNRDELLALLDEAVERLPEEVRAARWLLKEREEYLAQAVADGEEIVDAARARAERMVQRTEVAKSAERRARRTIEAAEAEARRLRHECEDFCDQKLAGFEAVLEGIAGTVAAGRRKLQGTAVAASPRPVPPGGDGFDDDDETEGPAFFDQDRG